MHRTHLRRMTSIPTSPTLDQVMKSRHGALDFSILDYFRINSGYVYPHFTRVSFHYATYCRTARQRGFHRDNGQ